VVNVVGRDDRTVVLRAVSYTFNDASLGPRPKKGAHRVRRPQRQRSFWKELPILVVVALALTFLIQTFIARPYMIPSGSMETTLHGCPGCTPDRVLVDKMIYRFSDPEPGEVVVFKGPNPWVQDDPAIEESTGVAGFFRELGSMIGLAPPDERDFVKRIIAVGGQTVKCCDRQNRVLVDGRPLDEPYIYYEPGRGAQQHPFPEVTVPDDAVFVMGDNRNNSSDSRSQGGGGVNGTVPLENIIGKAQFIVWPPGRWDGIGDHNPQGSQG
jgi:signal peptidase I